MKKLIFLIFYLTSFSFPTFAEKTPDGQTILFCPDIVECDSTSVKSCHLSNNPHEIWGDPSYSYYNGKLMKGIYKLKEVLLYNMDGWPHGFPKCHYYINEKQPSPIVVSFGEYDSNKKYNYRNYFTLFLSESSKWDIDGNARCLSDNPLSCPMIEAPEIATLNNVNYSFYYLNENSDWEPNFIYRNQLSYDQLFKICGSTSSCIIDMGTCDAHGDY
ncbi:TPA: hypothetical protein U6344_003111, partial [Legionella pneumophila]|nr:hypothetical protein [Legionella pneumophila]